MDENDQRADAARRIAESADMPSELPGDWRVAGATQADVDAEDEKARRMFALLGLKPIDGDEYRHLTYSLASGERYDLLEAMEAHIRLLGTIGDADILAVGKDEVLVVSGTWPIPDDPGEPGMQEMILDAFTLAGVRAVVLNNSERPELVVAAADEVQS